MNKLLFILFLIIGMVSHLFSQTDENTDADSTWHIVTVKTGGICANIPNHFEPNRDGIDDEWCIKSSDADKCVLWLWTSNGSHVYWGKEYEVEDNRTVCLWDNGIGSGGTTYHNGTYYYTILLKNTTTGTERTFEGSVTLFGSTRIVEEGQGQ